uniref:dTDP-4-amino-4,6-dideoxygalactose transaminase n=2 Tax=Roseivirga sp. TaxID=1964215 RepID=UPI004047C9E1
MGELNHIGFNKPYLTGKEAHYIYQAVYSGKLSGNGIYTQKCHKFFKERYGFQKCLLTTSCTDALEMAAILLDIKEGDEVIMPSYTFVSTANAFVLRGAKIVFCDSRTDHPGIDENQIEALINPRTKAIVVVHYAGVACDMDLVMDIANRHQLYVVEDAAQAIDSYYKGKPLGGIGHLAAFSFHETKNIISGEGGMLVINDPQFEKRAEIIWEKGTNRSAFFRGEVDKYSWVDMGSSFLPSELISAFLYAQIENLEDIQGKRKQHWVQYENELSAAKLTGLKLPQLPKYASNNAHMFYLTCANCDFRAALIDHLRASGVNAVFHYLSLHKSPFYTNKHDGRDLIEADRYSGNLVRLPLYYELRSSQVSQITQLIIEFCNFYRI